MLIFCFFCGGCGDEADLRTMAGVCGEDGREKFLRGEDILKYGVGGIGIVSQAPKLWTGSRNNCRKRNSLDG